MKVYQYIPDEPCSGGCVIIAANNEEEANKLLIEKYKYNDYFGPIELSQLTANVDTPRILINQTYFE